ncbi:bacteriohemerythrin [Inhella sp.]|uniref:bacteriohemerythrin n=1 Tax=Inhella sp. TaxID=1921806 RepID=UPI0035B049E2
MSAIDIFVWSDRFNTGLVEIDQQHARLVELLNRVARQAAFGADEAALRQVLQELLDYTDYHFRTEEALWAQYLGGREDERAHQQMHRDFVQRVQRLLPAGAPQPVAAVIDELQAFLVHWLASHILECDRHFARVVLDLRRGVPLAQALQGAEAELSETALSMIDIALGICSALSRNTLRLMHELAARDAAERGLRLAASVFEHANEGIMITDPEGCILDVNTAFSRITGYSRAEALGQNARLLKSGRHGPEFYAAMWAALREQGSWSGEIWGRRHNGELSAMQQTISAVRDPQGQVLRYVALFTDITTVKHQQQQLDLVATHDPLTHLPNRALLTDRLQQALAQARRHGQTVAVAYLDLDDFKQVNERFGSVAGDRLLVQLAERMRPVLRSADTLARLGGDEFVAVLPELASAEAAEPVLSRLRQQINQPIELEGESLQLSASLGLSYLHQAEPGADADQLLRQAGQAMFQAKQAGRNRLQVFDAAGERVQRDRQEQTERLRQALERQEFVLHFQPKVQMRSGQVLGAEALIRWQHPQRGLVAPAEFLPLIEDQPLELAVGEWVLETALSQIEAWRAIDLVLPLSINVGAHQLGQADFLPRLQAALARHPAVQPGDLEIEVLETSALDDMLRVADIIRDCKSLGVGFALDDFGTGYSSLAYLKQLAADRLKIDQSFVRDMLDDPDDLAILEGVLGLAAAFRREVIAEGVESEAHGEMLLRMGCEQAQGYAIARPMPAAALPGWVQNWRPPPQWDGCKRLPRSELPLLSAVVELRAWLRARRQGSAPPLPASLQTLSVRLPLPLQQGLTELQALAWGPSEEALQALGEQLVEGLQGLVAVAG